MNYLEITFLFLITSTLIYTALRLSNAILGNYRKAAALRESYAERIRLLPMSKMLRTRAITAERLLHELPVNEIDTSIRKCESCTRNEECETALKNKTQSEFNFCPNDEVFIKLKEVA